VEHGCLICAIINYIFRYFFRRCVKNDFDTRCKQLIELLQKHDVDVVEQFNQLKDQFDKDFPGERLDLSSVNISGRHLKGINFQGVILGNDEHKTNLEKTDLDGANLDDAQILNCNLKGATLKRASLHNVNIRPLGVETNGKTNFNCADFSAVSGDESKKLTLSGLISHDESASFRGANFEGKNVGSVLFTKNNFLGASFKGATLGVDMTPLNLHDYNAPRFSSIDLRNATILPGSSLAGAKLSDANFAGATLNKVDFSGAKLENANFHGADLSNIKWDAGGGRTELGSAILYDVKLKGEALGKINPDAKNLCITPDNRKQLSALLDEIPESSLKGLKDTKINGKTVKELKNIETYLPAGGFGSRALYVMDYFKSNPGAAGSDIYQKHVDPKHNESPMGEILKREEAFFKQRDQLLVRYSKSAPAPVAAKKSSGGSAVSAAPVAPDIAFAPVAPAKPATLIKPAAEPANHGSGGAAVNADAGGSRSRSSTASSDTSIPFPSGPPPAPVEPAKHGSGAAAWVVSGSLLGAASAVTPIVGFGLTLGALTTVALTATVVGAVGVLVGALIGFGLSRAARAYSNKEGAYPANNLCNVVLLVENTPNSRRAVIGERTQVGDKEKSPGPPGPGPGGSTGP
jgi:uncharacterized protein YjbI with pentapeptide repeats